MLSLFYDNVNGNHPIFLMRNIDNRSNLGR
jgi:hypothetical protein